MRAVLDTSVLIGEDAPDDVEAAISVVSLTELHFGVLLAIDDDERARRTDRLAAVEATFDPLPVTSEVARAWSRLALPSADAEGSLDGVRSPSSSPPLRRWNRCRCSPTTPPTFRSSRTSSTYAFRYGPATDPSRLPI